MGGSGGGASGCSTGLLPGFLRPHADTGVLASTLCSFCWGFRGPTCALRVQGLAAAVHNPKAGHWGGTPELGVVPQRAGHAGRDSRTQGGPMVLRGKKGGVPGLSAAIQKSLAYVIAM